MRLVIHGHPLFAQGLRYVLRSEGLAGPDGPDGPDGLEAAGVQPLLVGRLPELLDALARHRPDVVVADLDLPDDGGLVALRMLRAKHCGVPVLAMATSGQLACQAVSLGASGFLTKVTDPGAVRLAVEAMALGVTVFCPGSAVDVLDRVSRKASHRQFHQLSSREHEVLELLACGLDNGAIARELRIHHKTVRNHLSHILAKLRVDNRGQAILRAHAAGVGLPATVDG